MTDTVELKDGDIIRYKDQLWIIKKYKPTNAHGLDPTVTAKSKRSRKGKEAE